MKEKTSSSSLERTALLFCLAAFGLAAVLWAGNEYAGLSIPPLVLFVARWMAIVALIVYAWARKSLTTWILVSMVVGAEIGHDWPGVTQNARVISLIFLRLIKTIIAPLIFATLVVGIAGHPNLRKVGRLGIKSLIYFEVVTTIALFIGLAAINLTQAGVGIQAQSTAAADVPSVPKQSGRDVILNVFPENIAKAIAEGHVLQVVVFSIIFGIALALLSEQKRKPMLSFCEGLSETMFKFTNLVMGFAPFGVGAAIAYAVGHMGIGILVNLAKLLGTLYAALTVFLLFVLLPIALVARVPLRRFFQAIAEPVSIAFATTSSEAALPRAMENLEKMGVPRPIVAFVMPTGYSFNLDGSTLYLSLATLFVAQAAGVDLTLSQQVVICLTLMLTSKGVAGVPRATLVILLGTAAQFHLPEWPIFIILGIDELMDMARTSVNVIGNCLATVVMARWEGEFPPATAPVAEESPAR